VIFLLCLGCCTVLAYNIGRNYSTLAINYSISLSALRCYTTYILRAELASRPERGERDRLRSAYADWAFDRSHPSVCVDTLSCSRPQITGDTHAPFGLNKSSKVFAVIQCLRHREASRTSSPISQLRWPLTHELLVSLTQGIFVSCVLNWHG
jgi:hypothetical protein